MASNKTLLDKDGIKFIKLTDETFHISFTIENNIDVSPLINLNIIKLIYDLNSEFFDSIQTEHINSDERQIYLLFKDLFADIGIPQYYYHFNIKQHNESAESIKFIITPTDAQENKNKNNNADTIYVPVPMTQCELSCSIVNKTLGQINIVVQINNADLFSPTFFEKMVAMILYKLINRLKQFISNII